MARTPPARTAGQRPLIAAVALVVLAIGAAGVADEHAADRGADGQQQAPQQGASAAPEPGRTAELVGPARGADVQTYVEDRTSALLEAPEAVDTAVVSFSDTLSVDDALTVVGGVDHVRALLFRLPLERATPRTVRIDPGDDPAAALDQALAQQKQELEAERQSAIELLDSGTVEDEDFVADYERRVEELEGALAAAEDGRVVHAVVLRAPLEVLQGLVEETAVRLVDPAPPGTDVGVSVFHGLQPSDTDTVSHGRAP